MKSTFIYSRIISNFLALLFVLAISYTRAQTVLTYNYTGSVQNLTIPACVSVVTIEVRGAQGGSTGSGQGGLGAIMKGTFNVTGGSVLNIMVGGQGTSDGITGSGGGGSGVAIGGTPLIIAGGGGGIDNGNPGYAGMHAVTTANGVDGSAHAASGGAGGADGLGTIYVSTGNNYAYGGRGWLSGNAGSFGQNGSSGNTSVTNGTWGLGGGGGSVGPGHCNCGGGGGGYSGGGSGEINNSGGGGGSYNSGSNQVNTPGANSGNGVVIITYINVIPTNNAVASPSVICYGGTSTITSSAAGSYTWSTGANTQSIIVSPTVSTIYTVSSTASITCIVTSTIGLIVKPNPTVAVSSSSNALCNGASVNLNATATASAINWYTVATGGSTIGTSASAANFPVSPSATTTYYAEAVTGPASGSQTFNYTGTIDSFTVPAGVSYISIDARGAQGGNGGGLGAQMQGVFNVTPGQVLKVLVGQAGGMVGSVRVGGGGGSFVTDNLNNPIVIAGGGGGRAQLAAFATPGINANITPFGNDGYSALNVLGFPYDQQFGLGGAGGSGGTNGPPAAGQPHAGNGGGLLTDGAVSLCGGSGMAFVNGGAGGAGCSGGGAGGFGGGGGGGWNGGGGGGGYSGGGGSYDDPSNGGGGGSYSGGYYQQNTAGVQSGNGQVIISWNVTGGCITVGRPAMTITVNPLPTVTASVSNPVICFGGTTTVSGSGANTYTWTGGAPNAVAFSPAATTSYSLTGTDLTGCTSTNTAVQTITVHALPNVAANATGTFICINDNVTLNGSGALTYTWTGGITDNVSFAPTTTQTYTVTGTDGNNCKNTASKTVTVNPLPNVTAGVSNSVICRNAFTTLNGGGANTYTWTGGAPNGTAFSPTTTTTYSVTGTSLAGCTSTNVAAVTVTVNPLPTVTANVSNPVICFGGTTTVSGSGANTYTWTGGAPNAVAFSPAATTSYSLTGTDLAGCTSTNTAVQTVTVHTLPNVTANATGTFICINDNVTLNGSGALTYTWTGGITDNVSFAPTTTQTYTVTGTDGNNCKNTASKTVTVNPLPNVTASISNSVICRNAFTTLNGGGASTYTWTGGAPNGAAFSPTTTTTYSVTGTSLAGCTSTNVASVTVTVNPLPTVTANVSNPVICYGGTTSVYGSGANTYTWTGGVTDGAVFLPTVTASYSLTGTDLAGCTSTNNAVQTITVNPLPVVTAGASTTSVCYGETVVLTGNNADTYTWTGGVTNASPFYPTVTTTYSLSGTSLAGCTSTNNAAVTITVHALPTVTASILNPVICLGGTTTLNGSGAVTYTWSPAAPDNVAFSPMASENYSLSGTDAAGCTSTNSAIASLTVNALPVVTAASSSTAICIGGTVTLNGGGANTYTWSGSVVDNAVFSPTTTDTYTVTGTDINTCKNSETITVIVNALPNVTATAVNPVVCVGGTVILNGTGAGTYTWTGGQTDGVAFIPAVTTSYSLSGTDAAGCTSTNTAVQTITVLALPVVSVNVSNPVICFGGTTSLNGSGASTYTWTGGVSDGVIFSPAATNTYSLSGTDLAGCTSSNVAVQTITVNLLPLVTANSSSPAICIGNTVSVNGGGANTYTWTNSITDNVAFSPTLTATYTVTGTDLNNCENSASVTVTVNSVPTITAYITKPVICFGDTTTLSGAGANTYTWSGSAPNGTPFSPAVSATYTLTATNLAGCTNTNVSVVSVTVNALPVLTITPASTVICMGYTTSITGSGASGYVWTNGVVNAAPFSPTSTATYTLTGTDLNNCSSTATQVIVVNSLPVVMIASSGSISCEAETVSLTASGASTYTWNTLQTSAGIISSPTITTTYTVNATDNNGCENTASFTQSVTVCPEILSANASVNNVSCKGRNDGTITLSETIPYANKEVRYLWLPAGTCPSGDCNTLDSLKAGTYTVTIKVSYTLNNILAKNDSIVLNNIVVLDENPSCELDIYNGLTPNGDGLNDTWTIKNIDLYPKNQVMIFARWGAKIADIKGYNNRDVIWPSPDQANELTSATYFYYIDLGDGSAPKKGWLEVMKSQ